ncbi:MAG: hypothetical protein KME30_30340 [Iphinoe sp. HA4291-MV1]|jgi:hypothetical protein|nr:hypothetical protein [Iphinoe sp. HA4291-MV1]
MVVNNALRTGNTKGCGCFLHRPVHGHCKNASRSKVYQAWSDMKQRCDNPNHNSYKDYGGRRIKICKSWYNFEKFLADMGEPASKMTLDRIDVNGNYEASNCRWITQKEQSHNKRNNHYIFFNGRNQTLTKWAEELEIKSVTLHTRLSRGWSVERAFTTATILKNKRNVV